MLICPFKGEICENLSNSSTKQKGGSISPENFNSQKPKTVKIHKSASESNHGTIKPRWSEEDNDMWI